MARFVVILLLLVSGCDSVTPSNPGTLVLEAFIQPGQPFPSIRVSETAAADATGAVPVTNAEVVLIAEGITIGYEHAGDDNYEPTREAMATPGSTVFVRAETPDGRSAYGTARIPDPIELSDVSTTPFPSVQAILLDSLSLSIDSLSLGSNIRSGFVFPVQTDLTWSDPVNRGGWWINTRLRPRSSLSSPILDLFLVPEAVFEESERRSWTGLYALGATDIGLRAPEHELSIVIVRSDASFAGYVANRSGSQREPAGNVNGGLGVVAGLAVDSIRVTVR